MSCEDIVDPCLSEPSWSCIPDSLLLNIVQYLAPRTVLNASQTCSHWHRVCKDELLWKGLFCGTFSLPPRSTSLAPHKYSWMEELRRLTVRVPSVQSEVCDAHSDEVLHVSFAHNGTMFSTASKDAYIKVWSSAYPLRLRFSEDMKTATSWIYTQYSEFNDTDTLLLVSGILPGTSTGGEIAVFSLEDSRFVLQCIVPNKPYDAFGTWFDSGHILSCNLRVRDDWSYTSEVWINKAAPHQSDGGNDSSAYRIYRFLNRNASSLRTFTIARCQEKKVQRRGLEDNEINGHVERSTGEVDWQEEDLTSTHQPTVGSPTIGSPTLDDTRDKVDPLRTDCERSGEEESGASASSRRTVCQVSDGCGVKVSGVESQTCAHSLSDICLPSSQEEPSGVMPEEIARCESEGVPNDEVVSELLRETEDNGDLLFICTTGDKTYTPHQLSFTRISRQDAAEILEKLESGKSAKELRVRSNDQDLWTTPWSVPERVVDFEGHIIGMCLSPDHRYLYVNCRAWPAGCQITDPWSPPPISQEIDIHVIDLHTMERVNRLLRAHKAFTPSDECFFIFLDVSTDYVASGAEDNSGYLWDRHYGAACLQRFSHSSVVNAVAFNPRDAQTLVSVSDDKTLKVWRSKERQREVEERNRVETEQNIDEDVTSEADEMLGTKRPRTNRT